jgi:hypothetical protein
MRTTTLRPEFVEFIPEEISEGTLFISIRFRTAVHLCACGCGTRIATPLSPADWELIFDGETVSLWPSVGNWSLPCQSHYWIRHNRIDWSKRWSRSQIEAGRDRDRRAKQRYLGELDADADEGIDPTLDSPRRLRWAWLPRLRRRRTR